MSATPDPSRSRPTSMLVSLVLRVIAPLRMAISLPRAALGGVIASRASLGHRGFVDDPRPPGFVGRRDSISKAPMSAGAGRHRPLQGMTDMNMKPTKFGVGQSITRLEDIRLVSGRGNYATDAVDKAELKAVFLRSPYGHAKFRVDDIEAARAAPGVRAVYVASDFANLGDLPCLAPVANSDGSNTPLKPYPVMAVDETHHVGDIFAMVVAGTALQARDAAELISVTWDGLPAVTDMEAALRPDAPLALTGAPGNVVYDTHIGDKQETDKAFAGAAHTVRIRIVNPRAVANYMEPRSAVGEYDAQHGRLTLNAGSQGVHILQGLIAKIL